MLTINRNFFISYSIYLVKVTFDKFPHGITHERLFDVSNIKFLFLKLSKIFETESFLQALFFRFLVFVQSSGFKM